MCFPSHSSPLFSGYFLQKEGGISVCMPIIMGKGWRKLRFQSIKIWDYLVTESGLGREWFTSQIGYWFFIQHAAHFVVLSTCQAVLLMLFHRSCHYRVADIPGDLAWSKFFMKMLVCISLTKKLESDILSCKIFVFILICSPSPNTWIKLSAHRMCHSNSWSSNTAQEEAITLRVWTPTVRTVGPR